MKHALYLIGRPAAGKSTLAAALVEGLDVEEHLKPVPHQRYPQPDVVQLGKARPEFPGTDTLSMAVITPASEWLTGDHAPDLLLAEGDRLAVPKFFDRLRLAGGYKVVVAYVDVSEAVIQRRREARDWRPNGAWLRGRDTKARRLRSEAAQLSVPGDNLTVALARLADASDVARELLAARGEAAA